MGIVLNWSSGYPAAIDDTVTNFPTVLDNTHDVLASHVNELAASLIGVETVVGGLRAFPIEDPMTPANGEVLVFNSGSGEWEAGPASGISISLQNAYDDGNAIVATAARSIIISNPVDAFDLLSLTRTFAGGGNALLLAMGAGTTGDALRATFVDSGDTIEFDDNGGFNARMHVINAASDSASYTAFGINYEGAAGDYEINGAGTRVFAVQGGGEVRLQSTEAAVGAVRLVALNAAGTVEMRTDAGGGSGVLRFSAGIDSNQR